MDDPGVPIQSGCDSINHFPLLIHELPNMHYFVAQVGYCRPLFFLWTAHVVGFLPTLWSGTPNACPRTLCKLPAPFLVNTSLATRLSNVWDKMLYSHPSEGTGRLSSPAILLLFSSHGVLRWSCYIFIVSCLVSACEFNCNLRLYSAFNF